MTTSASWIEANHPGPEPDVRRRAFEFRRAWQRALNERGWAGLSWPSEYGGAGATLVEQAIFFEEVARARRAADGEHARARDGRPDGDRATAPRSRRSATCRRSCPPTRSGARASPSRESGSDLASLKTRAVRDGDEWVVTGQKVWTTYGPPGEVVHALARTDPDAPKHRGLTYFLMDMEQDGVEVRPLRQITGEAEFNELFIEEARIPDENIVGGEDNGWSVAITTLMHERAGLAFALQVRRADRAARAAASSRASAARTATR